jgi:hypothetical protein
MGKELRLKENLHSASKEISQQTPSWHTCAVCVCVSACLSVCVYVCWGGPFFSPLGADRSQSRHPGSLQGHFYRWSSKGDLTATAYWGLWGQVSVPFNCKGPPEGQPRLHNFATDRRGTSISVLVLDLR